MRGLLDTSVFVALETGRPLANLPDEPAISVVTLAELHLGVLNEKDDAVRSQRLRTLTRVEREFDPIPIDGEVARLYASLISEARHLARRPPVNDSWIAATALRHSLAIFTQDADFAGIPRVQVHLI